MVKVHDFTATASDGSLKSLRDYDGVVRLTPQRERLESLCRKDKDRGLEAVAFPCNQFKEQEPGSDEEIQAFCKSAYDVTFPVLAKVDVSGPGAHPLYANLRAEAPGDFSPAHGNFCKAISNILPEAGGTDEVKWNFTRFLVGRGSVIKRYEPPVAPSAIEADLEQYL